MPIRSKAQGKLMQAVAHNPAFAKKVGISQKVGKEFIGMAEGGVPRVREAEDAHQAGMSVAEYRASKKPAVSPPPASDVRFTTGPRETAADREKGLAAALKKRGYAAGGSIDGCATRGKTRAGRR